MLTKENEQEQSSHEEKPIVESNDSNQEDSVSNEEEEEQEFEAEFPTRAENANVIAVLYAMFEQSDPLTANAKKRRANAMNKCLKIGKSYIDEIYDETFYVESKEED